MPTYNPFLTGQPPQLTLPEWSPPDYNPPAYQAPDIPTPEYAPPAYSPPGAPTAVAEPGDKPAPIGAAPTQYLSRQIANPAYNPPAPYTVSQTINQQQLNPAWVQWDQNRQALERKLSTWTEVEPGAQNNVHSAVHARRAWQRQNPEPARHVTVAVPNPGYNLPAPYTTSPYVSEQYINPEYTAWQGQEAQYQQGLSDWEAEQEAWEDYQGQLQEYYQSLPGFEQEYQDLLGEYEEEYAGQLAAREQELADLEAAWTEEQKANYQRALDAYRRQFEENYMQEMQQYNYRQKEYQQAYEEALRDAITKGFMRQPRRPGTPGSPVVTTINPEV